MKLKTKIEHINYNEIKYYEYSFDSRLNILFMGVGRLYFLQLISKNHNIQSRILKIKECTDYTLFLNGIMNWLING